MNKIFEAAKYEPDSTFDKTTNDIKDNYLESIASDDTNSSAITSFDKNFYPLCINNIFEAAKFEPEPKFENAINDIKDNNLKSIASAATNPSAIKYFDENFDPLCINNSFESEKIEPEPRFENTFNEIKANSFKSITSLDMNLSAITSKTLSVF